MHISGRSSESVNPDSPTALCRSLCCSWLKTCFLSGLPGPSGSGPCLLLSPLSVLSQLPCGFLNMLNSVLRWSVYISSSFACYRIFLFLHVASSFLFVRVAKAIFPSPTHLSWVPPHHSAQSQNCLSHHSASTTAFIRDCNYLLFFTHLLFDMSPWAVQKLHREDTWHVSIPALSSAPGTVAGTEGVLNKYLWDECIRDLQWESANYVLWTKSGLLPVCVNKVLLKCSLIIDMLSFYGCFGATAPDTEYLQQRSHSPQSWKYWLPDPLQNICRNHKPTNNFIHMDI